MKTTGPYPRVQATNDGTGTTSCAGGILLTETAHKSGLTRAMTIALARWRNPRALHQADKVCTDLALTLALGGTHLADIAALRAEPALYGSVASDPTVSRMITTLAAEPDKAVTAIRTARSSARQHVWALAGKNAPPNGEGQVVIDVDATLLICHSDKENAAPTWKKTFGYHPLLAFIDHGQAGTGEPLTALLRPGNAGSNTATDHIQVVKESLTQLPRKYRRGRKTLVRTDTAGGTHAFLDWLTRRGRWLSYSVGMTITDDIHTAITRIPATAWTPAYDSDGQAREGAWVAEITDMVDLAGWPKGMRLIVRAERPHPGAQLRSTDSDGNRLTCLATNTPTGQLADLELRHRRRARAEDRIRHAKDTGLRNLPLHGFAANRIWMELVLLAMDLMAWTQLLALAGGPERRWEPKKLRFRLLATAARLVRTGRTRLLRFSAQWPWSGVITTALHRLRVLPGPV